MEQPAAGSAAEPTNDTAYVAENTTATGGASSGFSGAPTLRRNVLLHFVAPLTGALFFPQVATLVAAALASLVTKTKLALCGAWHVACAYIAGLVRLIFACLIGVRGDARMHAIPHAHARMLGSADLGTASRARAHKEARGPCRRCSR